MTGMVRTSTAVLVVAVVSVFITLGAALTSVIYVNTVLTQRFEDVTRTQEVITCQVARTNRSQLIALREISESLSLPTHFDIPRLPAPCRD